MAEDAKSALTAEDAMEWAAWLRMDAAERAKRLQYARDEVDADGYTDNRLLAAKALHGQPFGFTQAHLDLLWDAVGIIKGEDNDRVAIADELHALADRIEALLPPERTDG